MSLRSTAIRRAGIVLVVVIVADQLSKALIIASIARGDRVQIIPGLNLVNVRNRGVAFGLLSGGHAPVLALIGLALAALIAYFATHLGRPLLWLPTGLLLGGAFGNLADRIRGDAVVDFIDPTLWPAFNLADAAITIGMLLLLVVVERGERSAVRRNPTQVEPSDGGRPG
jgi:signal peptidase II